MKIKTSYAAGRFFASNKEDLLNKLNTFKNNHKYDYNISTRAIIVPHAGYDFSGQLAFDTFCYLNRHIKNIFIIAPTHRKTVNNIALNDCEQWETPLGNLNVNLDIQKEISMRFKTVYCPDAFEEEHSIEVQLPFLKYFFKDIKIIPLLVGNDDVDKVLKIIDFYYDNPSNAFVISSDLSHFLSAEDAFKMDTLTARMIEDKNWQGFRFEQACGAVPVCALTQFCIEKKFSLIRVGITNSARVTNDFSKVVGYGGWFLYEKEKNELIKDRFSPKIIDIVKKTIDLKLRGREEINITNYFPYPPILDSAGACFVTLHLNNNLRGCIGSVIPQTSLLIDLIKNAHNAAFMDPRFNPLTRDEFEQCQISVSLIGRPERIDFNSEEDLLSQLKPNIDGVIIKDADKQALYLPSVWEILPNKEDFLKSLKQKAGFDREYFSSTLEAYRFITYEIK